MDLRPIGTYGAAVAVILATATINDAQVSRRGSAPSSSASHVAAEVTEGRLNPVDSRPGDTIVLKLKDDLRSNGTVVLKRGTPITGVVRTVAQSMMEIEWLSPLAKADRNLSIALRSVTYLTPSHKYQLPNAADLSLPGGVVTVSNLGSTSASIASSSSARYSGESNAAMRNMPSVVAVDPETSSAIENGLGVSSSGQLFRVGRGQLVTASGSPQSVDIFSHLDNDTVITSAGKEFEIPTGAQIQLLVGVKKK